MKQYTKYSKRLTYLISIMILLCYYKYSYLIDKEI